jgi:MFS family permease
MGVATAGVGLVPPASSIGYAAPAIVILLRVAQGLALGGEYGGAAVYVAEHCGPDAAVSSPASSRPAWSVASCSA